MGSRRTLFLHGPVAGPPGSSGSVDSLVFFLGLSLNLGVWFLARHPPNQGDDNCLFKA